MKEGELVLVGCLREMVGLIEGDLVGDNEGLLNVGLSDFWTLTVDDIEGTVDW